MALFAGSRVHITNVGPTEILAADAASTWGFDPALLIADEFCQWPSTANGKGMREALFSAMGKVKGSRLLSTSTSGDPAHWSHKRLDPSSARLYDRVIC
jgi:phage terminase large subunit-like protein